MRAGGTVDARALETLRSALEAEESGGAALTAEAGAEEPFGTLAAAGARGAGHPEAYAFVIESVLEGYLLHYGEPRLRGVEDRDLRLLAGDLAYALGLSRLAALGDLEAIVELADLISLCAQLHAEGRAAAGAESDSLPAALWALGTLAVGTGPWSGHARVKESVRQGEPGVLGEALAEARERAVRSGIGDELNAALIAFRKMVRAASRST